MKIRTNPERGAILTAVLLALAAWALVLLNFNSSNSHGLRHRLKAYEQAVSYTHLRAHET